MAACDTVPVEVGKTTVAKWKYNKKGALTLQFDDTSDSQAKNGVPNLAKRGLKGTWYANPGREDHYQKYKDVWEKLALESGQEFANHTMLHRGAKDLAQAEEQIGGCAKYIWKLRGPGASKLLAFAAGGATTWGISREERKAIAEKYHSLNRGKSTSMSSVDYGTTFESMRDWANTVRDEGDWKRCHFHGIGWDGQLGMDLEAFVKFLDYLVTLDKEVWIDGWSRVYQYQEERETAQVKVLAAGSDAVKLELTSAKDKEVDNFDGDRLFQEPLTLITEVPDKWKNVTITQDGKSTTAAVKDNTVQYEALPGKGVIEIKSGT